MGGTPVRSQVAPREASPFGIDVPHPYLAAAELLVAEDETVRNKWQFSIEPRPGTRGRLVDAELRNRIGEEASAGSLHLRLHPRNAPGPMEAILQASLDGTPLAPDCLAYARRRCFVVGKLQHGFDCL